MSELLTKRLESIKGFVYPHPNFEASCKKIELAIETSRHSGTSMSALMSGVTGAGKTTIIRTVMQKYKKPSGLVSSDNVTQIVPAYHCTVPSDATIKSLAKEMLKYLDPAHSDGTSIELTKRVSELVKTCQTKVIFLDEFQHLLSKKARNTGDAVTDWVKTLMDDSGVPIIISGMPECEDLIESNPQLNGRYPRRIRLENIPFDKNNNIYFSKVVSAFKQAIEKKVQLDVIPSIDDDILAALYICTGGNMRSIRQFFIDLISEVTIKNQDKIVLDDFISVADELSFNFKLNMKNPFKQSYQDNLKIIIGSK